jgi:L-fuculose-phosphate aldolase
VNEAAARRDLVRFSLQMHAAGWVANHDGNLSARVADDRIVCTPTSFSKLDVGREDLVVTDRDGKKVAGSQRPFSELVLHRTIYDARPEVRAVVHAHPPYATAYGVSGAPHPHPFLPEAVVSLGARIPTVPLTAAGAVAATALRQVVEHCDAALVAGNGVFAWGPTLELAYLRLELVEHLSRIAHTAAPLGGPQALPRDMVQTLVAKRIKGGLGTPGERGRAKSSPVDEATAKVLSGLPNADARQVAALAAEIARQLRSPG